MTSSWWDESRARDEESADSSQGALLGRSSTYTCESAEGTKYAAYDREKAAIISEWSLVNTFQGLSAISRLGRASSIQL